MFWNTDHIFILSGVGPTLPSHLLEQLGLKCCVCMRTEVQEKNNRTSVFLNLNFSFSVSVVYKVNNIKMCLYYWCILHNFFNC